MKLLRGNEHNLKKGDFKLIAVILLISGITAFLHMREENGNQVVIVTDGEEKVYSLNEDREIRVNAENGGYNIVVISDGKTWVKEADCKNQICVGHKPVYKDHESIVCIPNDLSIIIKSDTPNDIDN